MDKLLFFAFPAITFAVMAAGVVMYEIVNYLGHILL